MLVLSGDNPTRFSGNILLDRLFDAEIVHCPLRRDRDAKAQSVYDEQRAQGRRPYLIPYGGSSPLGSLAYANAMKEILAQYRQKKLPQPEYIVFGTVSTTKYQLFL